MEPQLYPTLHAYRFQSNATSYLHEHAGLDLSQSAIYFEKIAWPHKIQDDVPAVLKNSKRILYGAVLCARVFHEQGANPGPSIKHCGEMARTKGRRSKLEGTREMGSWEEMFPSPPATGLGSAVTVSSPSGVRPGQSPGDLAI